MLLAIDIGNSHIALGGYTEERLAFRSSLLADPRRTADQYAVEVRGILELYGTAPADVTGVVICSVVPVLTQVFRSVARRFCATPPLVLAPGIRTGLKIGIDDPAQLGSDLAAGAVAAAAKYPLPCIICDLSTAASFSVVDASGTFFGGAIAAGPGLSLEALDRATALLPQVTLECPASAIGRNTAACMQAGIVLGTAAMVEGLCRRMEEELGQSCTLVLTGSWARTVAPGFQRNLVLDEHLLLDGLRIIYYKNRK